MELPLKQIKPDPDQPRKVFDLERLGTLEKSIKKYGIINPLVVEKIKPDLYMLIDGERRYRCALNLKLVNVPVIVESTLTPAGRLIKQFHIQNEHEKWTNSERAYAMHALAEEMKMSMTEICEALGIKEREARRFLAFGSLINKDKFIKHNIMVDWAEPIISVKKFAKKISERDLGKPFTKANEAELEDAIVKRVVNGEFQKNNQITHLKDAFAKDPKTIKQFIVSPEMSVVEIAEKTGVRGAYALRNALSTAAYLRNGINEYLKHKDVKIDSEALGIFKTAREALEKIIRLADE